MRDGIWTADAIYDAFSRMGLHYGPGHRSLACIMRGEGQVLARLDLPSALAGSLADYGLHPALMDGAFQAATTLLFDLDELPLAPIVPFALQSLRTLAPCQAQMQVWARFAPGGQVEGAHSLDIDLCDVDGNVCVQMRGFVPRSTGHDRPGVLFATQVWNDRPIALQDRAPGEPHVMLCGLPGIRAQSLATDGVTLQDAETPSNSADQYRLLAQACFARAAALIRQRPRALCVIQLVLPNTEEYLVHAGLAGLFKSIHLEHPQVTGQVVFVDPAIGEEALAALLLRERSHAHDTVVRYAQGMRTVQGWHMLDPTLGTSVAPAGLFKEHGIYLLTGGLGGLGVLFAREILAHVPSARLVLTGRSAPDEVAASPEKSALLAGLQAAGAVEYRQLDLASPEQIDSQFTAIREEYRQINGIIHSAGMTADSFVLKKSDEEFGRVLAPKVHGTHYLDQATQALELDFFVLFSSLSAAVGNLGQADYAAANGFLDTFAAQRNRLVAQGLRHGLTQAIRWPLWRDGGMQVDAAGRDGLYETTGIRAMATATGMQMFYRSLASGLDQTLVMSGNVTMMRQTLGWFGTVANVVAGEGTSTVAAPMEASQSQRDAVEDFLCEQLASVLKLPIDKVDPAAPLEDYGVDSIPALDLTRQLEKTFGILPKTLFFEYLTIRDLASYFVREHGQAVATLSQKVDGLRADVALPAAGTVQIQDASVVRRGNASLRRGRRAAVSAVRTETRDSARVGEPIAIVGLSGRYPESRDLQAFWRNLRDGKDCITEVPATRWDWREYYSADRTAAGSHYSKWGGFIEGVDEFDARFFNISPVEAEILDPQERLFLQYAWMAIEDAGYTRAALQGVNCNNTPGAVGVYAGVMYGEYQLLGAEASLQGRRTGFASNPASIANRVSYFLNLHGPSMVVDTMCSSSLTAIHLACQDLRLGNTALGIAGGVNVTIHPNKYLMLSAGQFLSGTGQCQSFGDGGDGYIPGEGVGVVLLKRLADAERDGNLIYGVIRGTALSHGGKTNGYTVPNPQAQALAIRHALADADVDARHVSYLEAHGTGTKLGDPIEIAALTKVFRESTADRSFCLIGSAKSNIGHAEAAAGIAGLTKVLLQMKHGKIVPSLHSRRLNPHIDFEQTPFTVNQTLRPWERPVVDGRELPRIAGISSFGAGGSNAHLVVQEYVAAADADADAGVVGQHLFPLSARSDEQLRLKARDLIVFLNDAQADGPADLAAIAYTLQVGREAMDARLVVVADSVYILVEKLQAFVDGTSVDGVVQGQAVRKKDALSLVTQNLELPAMLDRWIAGGQSVPLAELWVKGIELDWQRLHVSRPRFVSLPTYPFLRQRHWIEVARTPLATDAGARLHPLVHHNQSDLEQQCYTSRFDGNEFFLVGAPGERRLGEAACLEMARVAGELAMPGRAKAHTVVLRDLAWGQPGKALGSAPLTLALFDHKGDQASVELTCGAGDALTVLCQGHIQFQAPAEPVRHDLAVIRSRAGETVVELALPIALQAGHEAYVLHPAILQQALEAAVGGDIDLRVYGMRSVRILQATVTAKCAWVRRSIGMPGTVDIDICTAQGVVCVELRGVRMRASTVGNALLAREAAAPASTGARGSAPDVTDGPIPAQEASQPLGKEVPISLRRVIALDAAMSVDASSSSALLKPHRIALQEPAAAIAPSAASAHKPRLSLAATPFGLAEQVGGGVALVRRGNGVYTISVDTQDGANSMSTELIADLVQALRAVQVEADVKVVLLEGGDAVFMQGAAQAHQQALQARLYVALAEFPYPLVAVARGDALGAGFLIAALCDVMICGETAQYGFALQGLYPSQAVDFFTQRFGRTHAEDFLYLTEIASGAELRAKGWTCAIVPNAEVVAHAEKLAVGLASKSALALRLLKQELGRGLLAAAQSLPDVVTMSVGERGVEVLPEAPATLALAQHRDGVLHVTIRARQPDADESSLLEGLVGVFRQVMASTAWRVVILSSELPGFLPEYPASRRADVALQWVRLFQKFDRPVIVGSNDGLNGVATLAALYGAVCVQAGRVDLWALQEPVLAAYAAAALTQRFGDDRAQRMLFTADASMLDEVAGHAGTWRVVDSLHVDADVDRIAGKVAALPLIELQEWRRQTAQMQDDALAAFKELPWAGEREPVTSDAVGVAVALESSVVSAVAYADGVLEVHMADREARNMFSPAFTAGMRAAFAEAERGHYKVVVLTGYDNYFAMGGTPDTLRAIHEGLEKFTDNTVFQWPLSCPVPVVAAMQGHALGAGWALGMFADFALFSDESRYGSPYMGYGFTPGAGATLVFPARVGHDLARLTLLGAESYAGGELLMRGLSYPVLARQDVLPSALALARRIARNPRDRLIALKARGARPLRDALDGTFERELAMHEETFVGQADTIARIEHSLPSATPSMAPAAAPVGTAAVASNADAIVYGLREMLAHELRMQESDIDVDDPFVDLGLDSITGVTWIRGINDKYGTDIEAIKVYSYPTLNQLGLYVLDQMGVVGTDGDVVPDVFPRSTLDSEAVEAPSLAGDADADERVLVSWRTRASGKTSHSDAGPIAVVGMAGLFAQSGNLREFWHNIVEGRDCISEVPKHRWDIDLYYQEGATVAGKTYSRWMGTLADYDQFDAAFFNISPREARSMDPQQRLFLQECWHGLEHAGYNPRRLAGSRCGVFVGCSTGDYHQLSRREQLSGQGFTGAAPSILAARISYLLDLHGPSLAIDTACSSSLVAIATACDSLASGGSDMALAGGVNVMAGPAMQIMTAQVGMLSPQGRCYSFDARADGIVNGEGVGVVVLKRLADAERDGDCIYGVVEGWGVNQDGKTNGITAPNADSQTRLQQDVYERFGIDPADIGLIEAHGTGTPLGDPIEVAGLKASFGKYTRNTGYCALGSVKSNIGHCLTAAGVSGFLKAVLALQHGKLPPTLHFSKLNQHITLDGSPFYISDTLRDWQRVGSAPRRAAINALGFSGTNAHVVVAEHITSETQAVSAGPVIVPLSGASEAQLVRTARELLAFVRAPGMEPGHLARIAYTLQVGREAMSERAALVVSNLSEFERVLQAIVSGSTVVAEKSAAHLYRGHAGDDDGVMRTLSTDSDFQGMVTKWLEQRELARLAEMWVKGLAFDWGGLYAGRRPRRIGLPGYPFAMQRFWIEADAPSAVASTPSQVPCSPARPAAARSGVQEPPMHATTQAAPAISGPSLVQLQQALRASLAEALFMQPSDIGLQKPFAELGLDSIIGVEWVKVLNKQYGTDIAAARIYDYPNVAEMAVHLQGELGSMTPTVAAAQVIPLAQLQQELRVSLAEALFMKMGDIRVSRPFTELGLDSIIGVEWVKALNKRYGTDVAAARIYDYPNIEELAVHLRDQIASVAPVACAPPHAVAGNTIEWAPKQGGRFGSLYFTDSGVEGVFEADGEVSLHYLISPESNVSLREHVVFGEHLLPTDAYIELVYSAYRRYFSVQEIRLNNIVIVNPLVGEKGSHTPIRLTFRRNGDQLQFFVRSGRPQATMAEILNMQGMIEIAVGQPARLQTNDGMFDTSLTATEIATNTGQYYAPLQSLRFGASSAQGEIQVADHGFGFMANPFVIYGALGTVINYGVHLAAQRYGASDDQFLPYRIGKLSVMGSLDGALYRSHAVLRSGDPDAFEFDVEVVDQLGNPVLTLASVVLRRVPRAKLAPPRGAIAASQPPVARPEFPEAVAANGAARFTEKVAIIGMSCRYPMSENVDALWENLKAGKDCVVEVPTDRWGAVDGWFYPEPNHEHTTYSKWSGLVDGIEYFDALFFGIAPAEAELIDPLQRIFLQECWKTIESAGHAPSSLANQACGVYVGCGSGDYVRLLHAAGRDTAGAAFMGTSTAILAARISYHLNLKGPAIAIDTACSSSLVAVHLACESIRNGENTMALAGGVNLLTTPIGHVLTSQVGMLSRDGRCAPFDASAGGIVFSEGCGVVLLKALSAAQRDNDDILGVIEGSGINQDGKTNGITAPSTRAQTALLRQVYERFDIDPSRIGYVEAHGTGTPLGDPIEADALKEVFGRAGGEQTCALGSIKSNIGHSGFAAGIGGIIKTLLCLRHRKLVPLVHFSKVNPHIELSGSPFYVNTEYQDWSNAGPRMACVSSFGFSGTNAHVVISEHASSLSDQPTVQEVAAGVFVPLSAKTEEQLRQQALELAGFLRRRQEQVDLRRMAYTLQVGRDAMDHRLAVVADSIEALASKLHAWLDGKSGAGVFHGCAAQANDALASLASDEDMRALIDHWVARKNLLKVGELWVRGVELDLDPLHAGSNLRRMALPTYPFARERCWVTPRADAMPRAAKQAQLHPMLHRNTSDLANQRYASEFIGNEFFVGDHRVQNRPMLPAVAYLEMVRAALEDALPDADKPAQVALRHVVWLQPMVMDAPRQLSVEVFEEGDGELGFEVYSRDVDGSEVLHCQGRGIVDRSQLALTLNLTDLRDQMHRGILDGESLYSRFANMGLQYGPAFRGVQTVHLGDAQSLVELRLPTAARTGDECVLPPSLMDGALQGSIPLIADVGGDNPTLPFALESLRVFSPCPETMFAWVRHSAEAGAGAGLVKVDIDLCAADGRVCVQMQGFSSRPLDINDDFDESHYASLIARIASDDISVDDAIKLG
ncbi:hypothetical protein GCM10027565_16000 [Bordetella tumulicola]